MYRHQILYIFLNIALFSVVVTEARRPGQSRFQRSANSADARFGTSLNTMRRQEKRSADQLDALLFQADLSLLELFEPNSSLLEGKSEIPGRMMKEEQQDQDQDQSGLIIDSQDLNLLNFGPDVRKLEGHEIQGSDEAVEDILSAIESENSCEIIIVQEEEYFQQQEMETFIQEELYYSEETGEVSIAVTVSQITSCQTFFQCKPQVHPVLGMRCFCRNVLVCETIYG